MEKQPIRLNKDPIIESIMEIRFTAQVGLHASDLLPGMLFSSLRADYPKLENLPVSQIPAELRKRDPNLLFKPTRKLSGKQFSISIGDNVLSISCQRPYVGWDEFQPKIIGAIELIKNTSLIQRVDRVSVKYVNLIPEVDLGALKASVRIGEYDLINHGCTIRTDIVENGIINIIQIITNATAEIVDKKEIISGLLLDIDCIYDCKDEDFWNRYKDIIENVRKQEKKIFFSMLESETLNGLEPVWDE